MTTPQTFTQLQFPTREECAVPDLLAARAAATPDKAFLVFEGETWSYGDAAREAWRTANALIDAGVGFGDYVSVWMPTGPNVLRAWFGTNAAGAVIAAQSRGTRLYLEHTLNLAGRSARRTPPARRSAGRSECAEPLS